MCTIYIVVTELRLVEVDETGAVGEAEQIVPRVIWTPARFEIDLILDAL